MASGEFSFEEAHAEESRRHCVVCHVLTRERISFSLGKHYMGRGHISICTPCRVALHEFMCSQGCHSG